MFRKSLIILLSLMILQSCASKKDVLYFQDADSHKKEQIIYEPLTIQPNDILSIIVTTAVLEAAIPFNSQSIGSANFSLEALKLQGYLVSEEETIDFPVLGSLSAKGFTIEQLEQHITKRLVDEGHLIDPKVSVKLLNAKVTILGEVRLPGTYPFTEQNITVPQALGYAGDLTILGERKDVLLIREVEGTRTISHIDLTSADWFSGPNYYVKPNDVLVVNPNSTKIKSSGFIGNAGIVLTIASLILTSIVLITR